MIPQEGMLVDGTAAENIDPFGNHTKQELENVLGRVGLAKDLVDTSVGEDGCNLSHGERALLAMARWAKRIHATADLGMGHFTIESTNALISCPSFGCEGKAKGRSVN